MRIAELILVKCEFLQALALSLNHVVIVATQIKYTARLLCPVPYYTVTALVPTLK